MKLFYLMQGVCARTYSFHYCKPAIMSKTDNSIYPTPSIPIILILHFLNIDSTINATIGFKSRHHFETASAPVIIAIATIIVPPSHSVSPPISIGIFVIGSIACKISSHSLSDIFCSTSDI